MDFTVIRFDVVEPGIARVSLDRPDRYNAYTGRMCRELVAATERYLDDDALRVLVVTGAGAGFCSGGDLKGDDDGEHAHHLARQLGHGREMRDGMHAVARAFRRVDKPVIAMVNGPAVAGGLTLALLCDIRIASDRARLGDTSGRAGLLPDEGGAWLFPRFMGVDRALKMVMNHEVYDATQALDLGLVTEVVPHDELEARTMALARELAARAPLAVRVAKQLIQRSLENSFDHSLEDAAFAVGLVNPSADVREGVRAFIEKRPPRFEGR